MKMKMNKAFIIALFVMLASFSSVIAQDKIGLIVNISPVLAGNSVSDQKDAKAVSLDPGIGGIGIGYFLPLDGVTLLKDVTLKVSLDHIILESTSKVGTKEVKTTNTSTIVFVDYIHESGGFAGLGIFGSGSVDAGTLDITTSGYLALRLGYNHKINDDLLVGGGLLYHTHDFEESTTVTVLGQSSTATDAGKDTNNAFFANVAYLF